MLIILARLLKILRLWPVVQYLVLSELFISIAAFFLKRNLKPLYGKISKSKRNILVFNCERWMVDLKVLHDTGKVNLFDFKNSYITFLSIFFKDSGKEKKIGDDKTPDHKEKNYYYKVIDDKVLQNREKKFIFATKILSKLKNKLNISAALNCSFWYFIDQEWLKASEYIGINTIVIFKEYTTIDDKGSSDRLKNINGFVFQGSYLCTPNLTASKIFSESLEIDVKKIKKIGLLRMDRIFSKSVAIIPQKKKIITFFSFGHLSASLHRTYDYKNNPYFSNFREYGFVELFESAHRSFARTAIENPEVQFYIKPKINLKWWIDEIDRVIKLETGKTIDEIDNLEYNHSEASILIQKSILIIGFNSTVILESIAMDQATLIPHYGEVNKYPENVYFMNFKELLYLSKSEQQFKCDIKNAIKDNQTFKVKDKDLAGEMIKYYMGFNDGKSAQRLIDLIDQ